MKEIIFYHPYELTDSPTKGSELRPMKMKGAFESMGYHVRLVTGNSTKRKKAIGEIKEEIKKGKKFDFLYAESSNLPIPLTDSHHFPVRPLQDYFFFKFLNKHSIPIGFFYRDFFWQVPELRKRNNFLKNLPRHLFHWIEWYGLKATVDHLFIPTESIARFLPTPWPVDKWSPLLPGCTPVEPGNEFETDSANKKLKLFYVGGIEPTLYNVEPLLQVVGELDGLHLTLCCREKDWHTYSDYYESFDLSNVSIVHASSEDVGSFYRKADAMMCLWPAEGYINITMPIKIIESIGYEVPLILLEGSESASLITEEHAGWVVSSISEAKDLLQHLKNDRSKLVKKKTQIRSINKKHSWEKRAERASNILNRLS